MESLTKEDRRGIGSVFAGGLILVFAANTPAKSGVLALFGAVAFLIGLLLIRFQ
ncbi:hypothetical protein EGH22_09200 [Halomicroarcula sp. F28]|uniref:hypothetical protein n=1 Tax=Haloarcula salinisoli TaxID=2487746 RepID=UPI001C73647E|nr:hypothetical protein [Halomicroarcula salinisoli]MBX0286503.1 hypothetical protein [Halomicroarcula salinisoli]